jgi:hypothetical protein
MATKNRTVGKKLAVTNSTIYTAPTRFEANIESIIISNASSAAVKVSLDWYDSVSLTYHTITELLAMAPNSMVQIKDGFWLQQYICQSERRIPDGITTIIKEQNGKRTYRTT